MSLPNEEQHVVGEVEVARPFSFAGLSDCPKSMSDRRRGFAKTAISQSAVASPRAPSAEAQYSWEIEEPVTPVQRYYSLDHLHAATTATPSGPVSPVSASPHALFGT